MFVLQHESPSMQQQKKELDWRVKTQKIDAALSLRPTKEQLADHGILDDSGLAPALHGAALSLNQRLGNSRLENSTVCFL